MKNKLAGFTLIEVIITVTIVGIIAAFAIPSYTKSVEKAHEKDAIAQLKLLHSAAELYESENGHPYHGELSGTAAINEVFHTNIISNGFNYYYYDGDGSDECGDYDDSGKIFVAGAWKSDSSGSYEIGVSSKTTTDSNNPCCLSGWGACPSLSPCSEDVFPEWFWQCWG
ncbi:MAG: prepilin-type N-terminal cleavage/methylation domain-containing protein [Candidatus Omnitrophica bacterium]|nr:prepilin-type N-terminal cleavage/methylation domain-containing protein [Candidatus Omnitrophota bacterium]